MKTKSIYISPRTQAFGRTKSERRGRINAVINIALRARSLREHYGEGNHERINRAARNMVNELI